MESGKAISVLTQLDYWSFLVELLDIKNLQYQEINENRIILQEKAKNTLRVNEFSQHKDMCYMALNSVLEFLVEAFKRDA